MTQKITLFICCLFTITTLFSQNSKSTNNIKVSGKVIDANSNQPLEYATIIIKNTETQKVSGGITDLNGQFSIDAPAATYEISVEFISFKSINYPSEKITSNKNLGVIKLAEDTSSLNEIVIIAEKSTVMELLV